MYIEALFAWGTQLVGSPGLHFTRAVFESIGMSKCISIHSMYPEGTKPDQSSDQNTAGEKE